MNNCGLMKKDRGRVFNFSNEKRKAGENGRKGSFICLVLSLIFYCGYTTQLAAQDVKISATLYTHTQKGKVGIKAKSFKGWSVEPVYDKISFDNDLIIGSRGDISVIYKENNRKFTSDQLILIPLADSVTQYQYSSELKGLLTYTSHGKSGFDYTNSIGEYGMPPRFKSLTYIGKFNWEPVLLAYNDNEAILYYLSGSEPKIIVTMKDVISVKKLLPNYYACKLSNGKTGLLFIKGDSVGDKIKWEDAKAVYDTIYARRDGELVVCENHSSQKADIIRTDKIDRPVQLNLAELGSWLNNYDQFLKDELKKDREWYVNMFFVLENGRIGIKGANNKLILPPSARAVYLHLDNADIKVYSNEKGDSIFGSKDATAIGVRDITGTHEIRLNELLSSTNDCSDPEIVALVYCAYNDPLKHVTRKFVVPVNIDYANEEYPYGRLPLITYTHYVKINGSTLLNHCPMCGGGGYLVVGKVNDTTHYHTKHVVKTGTTSVSNYNYGGYYIGANGDVQRYTVTDAHSIDKYEVVEKDFDEVTEIDKTEICPLVTVKMTYNYGTSSQEKHLQHLLELRWQADEGAYYLYRQE